MVKLKTNWCRISALAKVLNLRKGESTKSFQVYKKGTVREFLILLNIPKLQKFRNISLS